MAVSLELSTLFPTLLHLSTKGRGLERSFLKGGTGAVHCQKLWLLSCGGGWAGLGAAARALPEAPTGLGGQRGNQDSQVVLLGRP